MSLIHTCHLCGANPFDYLTELERHADDLSANPAALDALELPGNARQHRRPSRRLLIPPRAVVAPARHKSFSRLPQGHESRTQYHAETLAELIEEDVPDTQRMEQLITERKAINLWHDGYHASKQLRRSKRC